MRGGALLLTGEWGCGKTHLIENILAEELRGTHFIVRVSLLGLPNTDAVNAAVRKQWLSVCTPYLSRLKEQKDQIRKNSGLVSSVKGILNIFSPAAGSVASLMMSSDFLGNVPLEPLVEDLHDDRTKKRVVLVFDDLDRSRIDLVEVMGCINEYRENKGFNTIIIANERYIVEKAMKKAPADGLALYSQIKEKTVERTLLYVPDHRSIVHELIAAGSWGCPDYADFLAEHEEMILDVFASEPPEQEDGLEKVHSIRSLISALQDFNRLYDAAPEQAKQQMDRRLYSFIAFVLAAKNGIYKNGMLSADAGEEDIRRLYPGYAPRSIPESVRKWVRYGLWEEDKIAAELEISV